MTDNSFLFSIKCVNNIKFASKPLSPMKQLIVFTLFLLHMQLCFSQAGNVLQLGQSLRKSGKTYAVIVGISDYKDTQIKDLKFASRDAEVFSEYLKSKAGGSVPAEQIRLLTGENATIAAIYNALKWAELSVNQNDLFFFYFAGHGDVESSLYKLGFLLAYDTPFQNYLNNAVRIEDLNILANTLSVVKEVNTVIITDACHSGKLAGSDNRGSALVGDQLAKVEKKEVRLTSCEADQKSYEDELWGGGRGVFSFYLVKGLKGLADQDKDDIVTLQEIKTYLESNVSKDVSNLILNEQNPVVAGKSTTVLSRITEPYTDPDVVPTTSSEQTMMVGSSREIVAETVNSKDLIQDFFQTAKNFNLSEFVNFSGLALKSSTEIPAELIDILVAKNRNKFVGNVIDSLKSLLQSPGAQIRFNWELVAKIHTEVQDVINAFLKGDVAELERRRYYNSEKSNYDKYPEMIEFALKLIEKDHYLYPILQFKLHYFKGIAARIKMPISDSPEDLLEIDFNEQIEALKLEPNAPYVHNELGEIYVFKQKPDLALKSFLKAKELAPTWSVPLSNISAYYAYTKETNKGIESAKKAIELQPALQSSYINLGINYQNSGNLLFGEEQFHKSIKLNSRHYLPFERLGYLYTKTMEYAKADSFFYEADLRKQGFNFLELQTPTAKNIIVNSPAIPMKCQYWDTTKITKRDVMAYFSWGFRYYKVGDFVNAKRIFKKLIFVDNANPLVYRYLGEISYKDRNFMEAEIYFRYAQQYYLNEADFLSYFNEILPNQKITTNCILDDYKKGHFDASELDHYLGLMYEQWGYYEKATESYLDLINRDEKNKTGYFRWWQLEEKLGRFINAEDIITQYLRNNYKDGFWELISFYNRMQKRFPQQQDNYYKAGNLLYNYCQDVYMLDTLIVKPDEPEPDFKFDEPESSMFAMAFDENSLPDITDGIYSAQISSTPRQDGVKMFKEFVKLSKDSSLNSEALNKSGDLYYWAGSKSRALECYAESSSFLPNDAVVRNKLVDFCNDLYQFEQGLYSLNYLSKEKQLDYEHLLLLIKYKIHSGETKDLESLLKQAISAQPFPGDKIKELKGKSLMLSSKFKVALPVYLELLKTSPNDKNIEYTISRIYAQQNKEKEARFWLKKAIQHGFNYSFVLKYDEAWASIRKRRE